MTARSSGDEETAQLEMGYLLAAVDLYLSNLEDTIDRDAVLRLARGTLAIIAPGACRGPARQVGPIWTSDGFPAAGDLAEELELTCGAQ